MLDFKKLGVFLALFTLFCLAPTASATVLDCADGVVDVLALNPGGCSLGGLTFSNFTVTDNDPTQTGAIGILGGPLGTRWEDGVAYLEFSVNHLGTPLDIQLSYDVVATEGYMIDGIDLHLGTSTPPIRIIESAYDADGNSLADIQVRKGIPNLPNILNAAAIFAGTNFVHIDKDIQLQQQTSSISDFINSHDTDTTAIPEPGTYALMGAGLLALAAIRRRKA